MFTVTSKEGQFLIHCTKEDVPGLKSLGFVPTDEHETSFQINTVTIAMLLEECGFTADMENFGEVPTQWVG